MRNLVFKIILFALALCLLALIVFFLMVYFVFIPFDMAGNTSNPPTLGKPLSSFILILLVGAEVFTLKKLASLLKSQKREDFSKTLIEAGNSMDLTPSSPPEELVVLLASLAGYNDKGYIWQNDSTEKSMMLRIQYRNDIEDLITKIGEENFPHELLQKLRSEELLQDASGKFVTEFEDFFFPSKNQ